MTRKPKKRIADLDDNARKLMRSIILGFPIMKEFQRNTGISDDDLVLAVEELQRAGIASIHADEAGYELRFDDHELAGLFGVMH